MFFTIIRIILFMGILSTTALAADGSDMAARKAEREVFIREKAREEKLLAEKARAYAQKAVKQNNYSLCEDLGRWSVTCYAEIAVMQKDKEACRLITYVEPQGQRQMIDLCFRMVDKGAVGAFYIDR